MEMLFWLKILIILNIFVLGDVERKGEELKLFCFIKKEMSCKVI